jgi:hypothetical protein
VALRCLLLSVTVVLASVAVRPGAPITAPARASSGYPVSFAKTSLAIGTLHGVGTYIAERYPQLVGPALQRVKESGARWVREEFTADHLHHGTSEPYKFHKYDVVVTAQRAAHLHVLGILDYNNTFTRKGHVWMPHENIQKITRQYVSYVRAVVKRYRHQIYAWQVWNEPDIDDFWQPKPDAADYTYLLNKSYAAIKKANPQAKVLIAGPSGRDPNSVQFLQDVVSDGGLFDVLAIQPYADIPDGQMMANFQALHEFAKPIWFTEMGWAGQQDCSGCGDAGYQATRLSSLFLIAAASGVQRVFWYDLRDDGVRNTWPDHFGLLQWDFAAKPAFLAYELGLHVMDGSKMTGTDQVTPTFSLYRFAKNGRKRFAIWNDGPSTASIALQWSGKPVNVLSYQGRVLGQSGHGIVNVPNMPAYSVAYLTPVAEKIKLPSPAGIPLFPGHSH